MGTDHKRPKCCLCSEEVEPSGWCDNCRTYPINITPIRYCNRGHKVTPDGFCFACDAYVLTYLDAQPGEWIDTGRKAKRLTGDDLTRLNAELIAKLDTLAIKGQPKDRDIEREKSEMFSAIESDEVPF